MLQYRLSISHPHRQFIDIIYVIDEIVNDTIQVQLPSWRPGRYELGNFAKNIQRFAVKDNNGNPLQYRKITKDLWEIDCANVKQIEVHYNYYASELNAGSTFLNEEQLYVNPVNCLLYVPTRMEEQAEIHLSLPEDYEVATSLQKTGKHVLKAANVQELMDSPFIASDSLQHGEYQCEGANFHIWFQGQCRPDWPKIIRDFNAFTLSQVENFGDFPFREYHFLVQVSPVRAYHGVEHLESTVILIGPGHDLNNFEGRYREFLGVCSHELYHAWNIKAIRPIDLLPYDFTKENYSRLGYVCEGVTTYMGDLMLRRAGVFSQNDYLQELNLLLQRHFDNFGRFYQSVAEASFDTWLDGYVPGIPNRKVSIYTEGSLLALICHTRLLKYTKNQFGLDEVMRLLYERFGKRKVGYSEEDYWNLLEEVGGTSFLEIRDNLARGTADFRSFIEEALEYLGLEIKELPSESTAAGRFGFKYSEVSPGKVVITQVFPDGPADNAGIAMQDEIISFNGIPADANAEGWLNYFSGQKIEMVLRRQNKIVVVDAVADNRTWFKTYKVNPVENPRPDQVNAMKAWLGEN